MPPAYTKIRDGIVDSTLEVVKGKVFADYDGDGKLLGVEFLTTVNNVKVPDSNMPPYMNSGKSWTISLAALLIACCATANAQCFINAQGQMVCPNRPAVYGLTRPFQQRVQVTPQTNYTTSVRPSVSYGSTGGYISNVRDITAQRNAELKELGTLRAYKKTAEKQLKALRAENSVLRANAQPGAARVPTQEPARVGLPTETPADKYQNHVANCPQCGGEDEFESMCDEGFQLLQDALRWEFEEAHKRKEIKLPKVSLRLPPSTGLTLPPQTMLAVQ